MNDEIVEYKKKKIAEIQKIFTENMNRLYAAVTYNIRVASSMKVRNKQQIINMLIDNYNKTSAQLKAKLDVDIRYITKYNPMFDVSGIKNKKALLIGINYTNTPYALIGCGDDALRMRNTLSSFGFNKLNVLTDSGLVKPTKEVILREFKNLISTASSGDLLVFYFSGHGSYTYDKNGDESDSNDEMIVSSDLQGVLDDEFKQILSTNMKSGVTLIGFFDSCHSGTMFDLKFNYTDKNNYKETEDNDRTFECVGNVIMISGCMDEQTSSEAYINGKVEGAITWAFLETLSKNKNISWRTLMQSMRDILKTNGFDQLPQLSTDTFCDIDNNIFL